MSGVTGFRLVQALYWLSLGTWFGAMVMIFLAARSTFTVIPQYNPTIGTPPYNQPALVEHAPRILAGAVNSDMLRKVGILQAVCAAVVVLCVIAQSTGGSHWLENGGRHWANWLRIALITIPIAVVAVDALVLERKILRQRDVIYNPDLTAEQRAMERRAFGKLHGISMALATAATAGLLAALIVSPFAFRAPSNPPRPTSDLVGDSTRADEA